MVNIFSVFLRLTEVNMKSLHITQEMFESQTSHFKFD